MENEVVISRSIKWARQVRAGLVGETPPHSTGQCSTRGEMAWRGGCAWQCIRVGPRGRSSEGGSSLGTSGKCLGTASRSDERRSGPTDLSGWGCPGHGRPSGRCRPDRRACRWRCAVRRSRRGTPIARCLLTRVMWRNWSDAGRCEEAWPRGVSEWHCRGLAGLSGQRPWENTVALDGGIGSSMFPPQVPPVSGEGRCSDWRARRSDS